MGFRVGGVGDEEMPRVLIYGNECGCEATSHLLPANRHEGVSGGGIRWFFLGFAVFASTAVRRVWVGGAATALAATDRPFTFLRAVYVVVLRAVAVLDAERWSCAGPRGRCTCGEGKSSGTAGSRGTRGTTRWLAADQSRMGVHAGQLHGEGERCLK